MNHHVVRSGETLSAIAHRYGTTARVLARLNGIHDPNRVAVGTRLRIPGSRGPAPREARLGTRSTVSPSAVRPRQEAVAPQSPAAGATDDVTEVQIRAIMPNAGARAATYQAALNTAMRAHGINTVERRAAFLAQISVESGDLRNTEENLNYSAPRLREVWPRRFHSDEIARQYAHDPEALGNFTYANRNGNGDVASGDGYRYRGRGLMQTTGRANYRAAGYEDRPEALAQPDTAADSAARFWSDNGLNDQTGRELDRQSFNGVSRTVNGGDHGSNERWQAYQRALRALRPAPGG